MKANKARTKAKMEKETTKSKQTQKLNLNIKRTLIHKKSSRVCISLCPIVVHNTA